MLSLRRVRRAAALLAALVGLAVLAPLTTSAPPAGAAGITTHAWMGQTAIDLVDSPDLQALLEANWVQVYAGSQFPDSGYIPGNTYGEEAHWQRFHDAYAARIAAREDCPDLTDPHGPCADAIAHLMGAIAHGMGDEVWDWLYEPYMSARDEYFYDPLFGSFSDPHASELVLDIIAIGIYGRVNPDLPPLPPKADILGAFADAGMPDVKESELDIGIAGSGIIGNVEEGWTPQVIDDAHAALPWMSTNMVDGPGGVRFAARAIAGAWDSMWGQLLGDQPATVVTNTHPAAGARRVAATGWTTSGAFRAGSSPGTASSDVRIAATLSYAVPYQHPGGPGVSETLPEGAMVLREVDSGDPVPTLAGYPKSVPYGPSAGHHMVAIQPAADLDPCTWYQVEVTAALEDAHDESVTPTSWQFRTGTGPHGGRCADDPYTPEEKVLRATYQDLFGRLPGDAELEGWRAQRERGLTAGAQASALVGATEHRNRLVQGTFEEYLGRSTDPAGLAYWSGQIRTRSLTDLRAGVLASNELYASSGGTNAGYVNALYGLLLNRPPDGAGLAFWTARLDRGVPRSLLAKQLLLTGEVISRSIVADYQALLDRNPGSGEVAYWLPRVRAADERTLTKAILRSPEYATLAQAD